MFDSPDVSWSAGRGNIRAVRGAGHGGRGGSPAVGRGGVRGGRGRGARCSARSSLARTAFCQSGAGCGDVNCIGSGRERSVGRDVVVVIDVFNLSSASIKRSCVTVLVLIFFSPRPTRSSLREPVRPHQFSSGSEDPRNGEYGRSSRPWFVYVGPSALSLS